jgi:hypothetical protein
MSSGVCVEASTARETVEQIERAGVPRSEERSIEGRG